MVYLACVKGRLDSVDLKIATPFYGPANFLKKLVLSAVVVRVVKSIYLPVFKVLLTLFKNS